MYKPDVDTEHRESEYISGSSSRKCFYENNKWQRFRRREKNYICFIPATRSKRRQCDEFVEMANANVVDSQSDEEEGDAYFDLFFSKTNMPTYKVILLGDTGAGKTSLFLRYKHGNFRKGSTLYGADRYMKDFLCEDGEKVQVLCYKALKYHVILYGINDETSLRQFRQGSNKYNSYLLGLKDNHPCKHCISTPANANISWATRMERRRSCDDTDNSFKVALDDVIKSKAITNWQKPCNNRRNGQSNWYWYLSNNHSCVYI